MDEAARYMRDCVVMLICVVVSFVPSWWHASVAVFLITLLDAMTRAYRPTPALSLKYGAWFVCGVALVALTLALVSHDLAPGPGLVVNCQVLGFLFGIAAADTVREILRRRPS